MISLNYAKTLESIKSIINQLDTEVYIVDSSQKILSSPTDKSSIGKTMGKYITSDLMLDSKNSFFTLVSEDDRLISYRYIEKFNSYIVIIQSMTSTILDSFLISFFIVIIFLGLILFVVLKLMNYSKKRILHQASLDPLTGALNRAAFNEKLTEALELVTHYRIASSLIFIDIDNFKDINDEMGHQAGDEVIKKVAEIMSSAKRKNDIFFRWGGDEFAIIARCNLEDSVGLAGRILKNVREIYWKAGTCVTLSIGVSEIIWGDTKKDAFNRADKALYQSKENGKNRITFY